MGQTIVNEKKLSNMKFKRNVVRVGDYLQQSGNQDLNLLMSLQEVGMGLI